jgi:hypothetical protein
MSNTVQDPQPAPAGRAGDPRRPRVVMDSAMAAGIIVLIALAILVAIRFGLIDSMGD